jgi:hypothetical protein
VSALAWLCAAAAHGAEADAARVALVWKTPEASECASSEQIRAEVDRLSETPLVTSAPHFQIEALALLHEGSWVASVALRDAAGRVLGGREVSGPYAACRELDVPVALVVATLLDELRQQPAPAEAPAAAESTPPAVPTPPVLRGIGLGAFATGALGLAPRLTLGFGADVELGFAWPLVLSASAYLPGRDTDAEGRGVRLLSFHAGAAVCPKLVGHRHTLRLCGSAQAGAVLAKALGLTSSRDATRALVLLGIEPQLVLGLTPNWALQLSLGAHWLAVRPRFHWEIEGSGQRRAETEPFALMLRIGIIDFVR